MCGKTLKNRLQRIWSSKIVLVEYKKFVILHDISARLTLECRQVHVCRNHHDLAVAVVSIESIFCSVGKK